MRPLRVEFMNSGRGSWSRAAHVVKRADGGMFWWTVAITVLLGMATFSWIFSIYVFTHPEKPLSYRLLNRFHRLEKLEAFTVKNVPGGKVHDAKAIYQKFYAWNHEQLDTQNSLLRRNYITNYKEDKPLFLRGKFRVTHARPLTESDFFPHGMVARAVAVTEGGNEFRNVIVEYVIPTAGEAPPMEFRAGDTLELDTSKQKRRLWSSVLNVQRLDEDVLVFTVVPLLYGEHSVDAARKQIITASPPELLNLKAGLPITDNSFGTPLPEASVAVAPVP